MKIASRFLLVLFVLAQFVVGFPAEGRPAFSCGQTITEDTILTEDLACSPDTEYAIVIGASNITLDLGGHTVSGYTPRTGVFAINQEGLTIKNGTIDGFNVGVFIIETNSVTLEHLKIRNLTSSDPSDFLFGIAIVGSQKVVVRDSLFEFVSVAHKEAVEIFDSDVDISHIEVRGGGAGVSFSFEGGVCDPVNKPSNGTVRHNKFSNICGAGIWVACTNNALIEDNDFSTALGAGVGIQADAPFLGAVTGLTITQNFIHETMMGIEFRGILTSSISNNYVFDNQGRGIALRQSLGCIAPEPGWECFYSTANVIADNQTWGNVVDLYHYKDSLSNTWERNTCETKDGAEIPACTPPTAALTINYPGGQPGSFFTLEGANFPISSTATITINGHTLGTIPTDSSGDLIFLLNTDQADEGEYTVTAPVNPSSSVRFDLDSQHLLHTQEGVGTIFNVPSGLVPHVVYLPLILR